MSEGALVLCVDPGIRGSGVALFTLSAGTGALTRASYVKNPVKQGHHVEAALAMSRALAQWFEQHAGIIRSAVTYVSEWPRVYTAGKQSKDGHWRDPNDLPPLTAVQTATAALVRASLVCVTYEPREWKGTVDKTVMNRRVYERLSIPETGCIDDAGALTHNVLDAVGLGLKYLGRLEPKKVFPR